MAHVLPCGLPSDIVAVELAGNRKRALTNKARGQALRSTAASAFALGQTVRTKLNDRGTAAPLSGVVTAIEDGAITLDNGRTFAATSLIAVCREPT